MFEGKAKVVAVDSVRELIYWNDYGIIRKANLNGTGKKFVVETGK